ncbi:MAG: DUF1097 domain-containing protein [Gemmatimonadota bacterium]
MCASTTKALSLGIIAAVWAAVSHLTKLNFELWPAWVGLACFVGAGGGTAGLQKSAAGTVSGVVWALIYLALKNALDPGAAGIMSALAFGLVVFGMVYQARFHQVLTYAPAALAGAAVTAGLRINTASLQAGIKVAVPLLIGCVLGIIAERLADQLGKMKVVPAMAHR